MALKRTVILHYHLFKNAGTSVDRILKDNFPGRWETEEFSGRGGNNTKQVVEWIRSKPEAVAFSSHSMMGPIPRIEGVRIISVLFLRDPIQRIRSAYRFERRQDSENFGAVLAKEIGFGGYVRVRLALPHDRQCRNFQTFRLANLVPGPEPELQRAKAALEKLTFVGRVEDFENSARRLQDILSRVFPDLQITPVHANQSLDRPESLEHEIETMLRANNSDDLALLEAVENMRILDAQDI